MRGGFVTNGKMNGFCVVCAVAATVVLTQYRADPLAQSGGTRGDWRYHGADAASSRYSPLDQINRDNVKNLRIVWRWKADNFGPTPDFNFQVTPLMVGGVLYTTAGWRRDVVAINAATGETLWMFRHDEGTRGQQAPVRPAAGRGVAYWTDGKNERILYVTRGYQLIQLDAKTGHLMPTFGNSGIVDLYDGLDQPRPSDGQITTNSPPIVVRDVVVVGAALRALAPSPTFVAGFVRGYDVRTGKRVWVFHTIPRPGEFGNETWEKDSWSHTGNAGLWTLMSADEELGYVYLPIETPTNDGYGGHRPGDGLFGNSLVCLDARTGKRIWHFQMTHHDIWDYDLASAPNVVDITVNGRLIKAVALVTKQAFTYVFDRVTGAPVWPIDERPVPQSDVPGEKTSRTQPFPTKPPPFDRQGVSEGDLIDFTPEIKAQAQKIASLYHFGPLYSPPIVAGTNGKYGVLMLPAVLGGANWQGAAFDPETGMLYVPSTTIPRFYAVTKDPKRSSMDYVPCPPRGCDPPGAGTGEASTESTAKPGATSAGAVVGCGYNGPQGLPLVKPPWGRITAIDLNKGEHRWMIPNGEVPDCVKNHPLLRGVALPRTGKAERSGVLVTKTLLFAGEGGGFPPQPGFTGGPVFRALDKQTGAVVSEFTLPANQVGGPITYMVGEKQYIVVPVGTRGTHAAELVALALP
jgi:quinoprotein glucose dehydrogenase